MLKKLQVRDLVQGTGLSSDDISNTFWWAGTFVRLKSAEGRTEIEGLQAQSKLFRSMIIVLVAIAIWWWVGIFPWPVAMVILWPLPSKWYWAIWFVLLLLSVWRFCRLRWDATKRTYEYFLSLAIPSNTSADITRLVYSYWERRGYQPGDWLQAERELKHAPRQATVFAAAPFAGTWELKKSKKTGTPQKDLQIAIIIVESGSDLDVTIEGTDANDMPPLGHYTVPVTGGKGKAEQSSSFDAVFMQRVEPDEQVISYSREGHVTQTDRVRVSKDGKTMTLRIESFDDQGEPIPGISIYELQLVPASAPVTSSHQPASRETPPTAF